MWYVLQTLTGKEEELVYMIRKLVSPELYQDCFVAYYERIWRREQKSIIHVERLFPGYVFIVSDQPEKLFLELKRVPTMSKMMADGNFTFLTLEQDEECFFRDLLEKDHIVRLSYIETAGKNQVVYVTDPLKKYMTQLVRIQFKKRYAVIRFQMLGEERTAVLGIILKEDVQQELAYGKVEAPLEMPEFYEVPPRPEQQQFAVGDHIKVVSGPFVGMNGVIWKLKRNTIEIGIHLFNQDMGIEMPVENICKASDKGDYAK